MKYYENGKVYNMASGLNDFQKMMYMHLIDWKTVHLTDEPGLFKGQPYDYMFPGDYIKSHPIPPFIYNGIHDAILEMQKGGFAYKVHKMAYHMASSQSACVNLFMPILLDQNADEIVRNIPGVPSDFLKIDRERLFKGFCFEYWGQDFTAGKGLLGDHSNAAGTDSDIAIAYINDKYERCLWLIEHKLTEKEFTKCGGCKSDGNLNKNNCKAFGIKDIIEKPSRCHYHRIGYEYWKIMASRPDSFKTDFYPHECPFRGGMNQLWRNQLLAFKYVDSGQYAHVSFSVVHHRDNESLGQTMDNYKNIINPPVSFTSFANTDVLSSAENHSDTLTEWIRFYKSLYRV